MSAQKTVLIADDNRDFGAVLKLALEAAGYSVKLAENGREAIEVQRASPSDYLITDLVMPDGDGIEAVNVFRKDFPDTKIVVVTGTEKLDARHYLSTARLMGAHATFRKPFEVEELLRTLEEL